MKKIFKISSFVLIVVIALFAYLQDIELNQDYSIRTNIKYYIKNMFGVSKFETDNFIIDLPKIHWISYKNQNSSFIGQLTNLGKNVYMYPEVYIMKFKNNSEAKRFVIELCEKKDDELIQQQNQTINNFEVEVYECRDRDINADWAVRNYLYKNEYFTLIPYIEEFKPQYDKFFEGVRLKDK
ncbi:MAG: hypothetical protein ACK5LP_03805 [Campylobacteraceae bacterium]